VNALEALWRCQRAWEQSQPQLFIELYPDDGLDEPQPSALRFVEPAVAVASPEAGGLETRLTAGESLLLAEGPTGSFGGQPDSEGIALPGVGTSRSPAVSRVLNAGAEPCRDLLGTDGKSFLLTAAPAHGKTEPSSWANGSAAGASAPLIADGMAEQGVTGFCDSGPGLTVERAPSPTSWPVRQAGAYPSRRQEQPPDSVTPCADRVSTNTTGPDAPPAKGARPAQEVTL
jgi:hypothetical protein